MNIIGLEVFILTFLIVTVLVIVILEKQSIKHDRIAEIRKSINATAGPIVHGIIKVVFLIALMVVQFIMDFKIAMVFGIVGGIGLGLMTYFFIPKTKRNRAIIITNNLKTLGVQFILVAINWYIIWMESEQTMLIFSFSTVPIYFLAGMIFLRPTEKRNYLSVIILFVILLINATVAAFNPADIGPEVANPACSGVSILVSGDSYEKLIFNLRAMYLALSFVPSLFLYLGIVSGKKLLKRQEIEVTKSV